jgi:hypothetical protein
MGAPAGFLVYSVHASPLTATANAEMPQMTQRFPIDFPPAGEVFADYFQRRVNRHHEDRFHEALNLDPETPEQQGACVKSLVIDKVLPGADGSVEVRYVVQFECDRQPRGSVHRKTMGIRIKGENSWLFSTHE